MSASASATSATSSSGSGRSSTTRATVTGEMLELIRARARPAGVRVQGQAPAAAPLLDQLPADPEADPSAMVRGQRAGASALAGAPRPHALHLGRARRRDAHEGAEGAVREGGLGRGQGPVEGQGRPVPPGVREQEQARRGAVRQLRAVPAAAGGQPENTARESHQQLRGGGAALRRGAHDRGHHAQPSGRRRRYVHREGGADDPRAEAHAPARSRRSSATWSTRSRCSRWSCGRPRSSRG